MKKILLILSFFSSVFTYAQTVNDGFVTSSLVGRYNEDSATAFIQAFKGKLVDVRQMDFTNSQDLINYLNFNPNNLVSLEALKDLSQSESNFKLSTSFLQALIDIKNNVGYDYTNAQQIRSAIKRLAESETLNDFEATTLVYFDLSLQQLVNLFPADFAFQNHELGIFENEQYSGPNNAKRLNNEALKLPRWLRCGLYVVLCGITGTAGGIVTGAQIGAFFSAPGAVLGGAIGGVVGGVTGMLGGAIAGCD